MIEKVRCEISEYAIHNSVYTVLIAGLRRMGYRQCPEVIISPKSSMKNEENRRFQSSTFARFKAQLDPQVLDPTTSALPPTRTDSGEVLASPRFYCETHHSRTKKVLKMSDWDSGETESPTGDEGEIEPGALGIFNAPAMAIGQVFQGTSRITSMDFHEDGELCVTANEDRWVSLL